MTIRTFRFLGLPIGRDITIYTAAGVEIEDRVVDSSGVVTMALDDATGYYAQVESAVNPYKVDGITDASAGAQATPALAGASDSAIAALVAGSSATADALKAAYVPRRVHLILGWGQSNMSGRGVDFSSVLDPQRANLFQFGCKVQTLRAASEPLDMHDTPTGMGPLLQFARSYAERLGPDDLVVMVPSAHGGVPLSSNVTLAWRWGVSGNLSAQAVAQAQAAVAAATAAYPTAAITIDAILWFQGETDSTVGTAIPRATYQADLDALIAGARTTFGNAALPFIVYRMIPEALGTGTRNEIDACHQNTPYRVANTGVVPALAGMSNGDALHANAAQHRLNAPVAVGELMRIKSGRAPVFPDYVAPPTPSIGASLWIDTVTAADAATIVGRTTETGGLTWARATTGANNYTLGITSNELAPKGTVIGGATVVTVTNTVLSYWMRWLVSVWSGNLRKAVKVVDDQNYIVAYLQSDTQIIVRKYIGGVSTADLLNTTVAAGAHEIHMGWIEAQQRLIVRHNGTTILDTTVLDAVFQNVYKSGYVLVAATVALTARDAEVEGLAMVIA